MRIRNSLVAVFIVSPILALAGFQGRPRDEYIGIYGIIERVVVEPNEASPQRIKIWGVFSVPVPLSSFQSMPVQRGYVYCSVTPGREAAVLKEWAVLRAAAATGEGLGFGRYWADSNDPNGPHVALEVKVHVDSETAAPQPYPLSLS